jgi:hypothetical protein
MSLARIAAALPMGGALAYGSVGSEQDRGWHLEEAKAVAAEMNCTLGRLSGVRTNGVNSTLPSYSKDGVYFTVGGHCCCEGHRRRTARNMAAPPR